MSEGSIATQHLRHYLVDSKYSQEYAGMGRALLVLATFTAAYVLYAGYFLAFYYLEAGSL